VSLETVSIRKNPTVMIATPMYGGMCTGQFMAGVIQTINTLQTAGIQTYFVQLGNESLITRARNELTRIFLEHNLEYLMFIDSDIGFNGEAVLSLIKADKDIACGIYPKKEVDWVAVERAAKEGKTNLQDYSGSFALNFDATIGQELNADATGCVEVRHGATGFMLIKRHVFEQLSDKVPTYRPSTIKDVNGNYLKPETKEFFATSIDESGCLLSEDYHFCEIWRKHGGKIHANPSIKLQHVGTYIYSGDIIKAGGNVK
jgi:hypothetical protein